MIVEFDSNPIWPSQIESTLRRGSQPDSKTKQLGMSGLSKIRWTTWSELTWFSKHEFARTTVQLCDRLLQSSLQTSTVANFLTTQLPEVTIEFSAQWAAVIRRTPDWQIISHYGRQPLNDLPYQFLEEALDREASGFGQIDEPAGWSLLAVPLQSMTKSGHLFLLAGRNLTSDILPFAVAFGRILGYCLSLVDQLHHSTRRVKRLQSTLEVASILASVRETEPLLESIAYEATRLLDCDRTSIFIWDREHHQVIACPALGVEESTLRLPDDAGIVGEVIHSGKMIRVNDAYRDSRFDKSVDKSSGYTTLNLLCVPLLDEDGQLIGAFEAINKNDDVFSEDDDEILTQLGIQAAVALRNTREREQLIRSHQQLTERISQGVQIIGESPAIVALRTTIDRLANTDLPVLILGESGTGKEVVSQTLHYQGPRTDHPFVAVNCAALSETLLESELFGHEKGAFTDAHETRQGKFELAEGGTLFLDEIGDMSLGGQAKLLRVLEEKVITRVGGTQTIPIDVRIVAATNSNLVEAVHAKRLREDLYYRLSVVTLELPPLRERPNDILPLIEHFLEQFSIQAGRQKLELSAEARRRLQAHAWPGNVRELRNLMERVAFLCPGDRVQTEDLAFILSPERDSSKEIPIDVGLAEATKRFQQDFIRRSIKRVNGNMSEAARLLGLHRSNLYRKMLHLDMNDSDSNENKKGPLAKTVQKNFSSGTH